MGEKCRCAWVVTAVVMLLGLAQGVIPAIHAHQHAEAVAATHAPADRSNSRSPVERDCEVCHSLAFAKVSFAWVPPALALVSEPVITGELVQHLPQIVTVHRVFACRSRGPPTD